MNVQEPPFYEHPAISIVKINKSLSVFISPVFKRYSKWFQEDIEGEQQVHHSSI